MFQVPAFSVPVYQNDRNNNVQTIVSSNKEENNYRDTEQQFQNITSWRTNHHRYSTSPKSPHLNQMSPNENFIPSENEFYPKNFTFPSTSTSGEVPNRREQEKPLAMLQNHDDFSTSTDTVISRQQKSADLESSDLKIKSVYLVSSEGTVDSNSSGNFDQEDSTVNKKGNDVNMEKEKPYRCTDCGKGFSQMRNYKYHR